MEGSEPEQGADAVVPEEELRLALVLNGGVSLAVWMGGVAQEIQRLTVPDATGYAPVLALARTRAVADVISGTSAGGINGAALALGQVNTQADLRLLRGLWSDQGRMEELVRQPFQGEPTSLLRGDDYFLPELRRAMRSLAVPFERRTNANGSPTAVDLTITTTLLTGSPLVTVDDLGQDLTQRVHDATVAGSRSGPSGSPPRSTPRRRCAPHARWRSRPGRPRRSRSRSSRSSCPSPTPTRRRSTTWPRSRPGQVAPRPASRRPGTPLTGRARQHADSGGAAGDRRQGR